VVAAMLQPLRTAHDRVQIARPSAASARGLCRGPALKSSRRPSLRTLCQSVGTEPALGELQKTADVLRIAADTKKPRAKEVLDCMLAVSKGNSIDPAAYKDVLCGTTSPGRRWRLVFTADKDVVANATKKEPEEGKGWGQYWPVGSAAQRWNGVENRLVNGVYLGHLASLLFYGPFVVEGKKMMFDYTKLEINIGPLSLKFDVKDEAEAVRKLNDDKEKKELPFFVFQYADDNVCVARGKSGGIAVWRRTDAKWDVENGIRD